MSYAKSLGKEEEKRYASALESGGAATYVDEAGERHKGLTAHWEELAGDYKTIYDEQVAANEASAESAARQAQLRLESETNTLNEEYGSVNKGLYRQYRKALQSLPQELAAMGYTGGASESSRVELERGYEENVGGSERARLAALAELRAEEAESLRAGQQAADEANAAARQEYLGSLIALREKAYKDERERAEALAAAGDFSGYEALGYGSEEIERLRLAWETENPELAMAVAAHSGLYTAADVAAKPAAWVQRYLNALGYALKVDGNWNSATESAYRTVFGQSSGRYTEPRYYRVRTKTEEKKENSSQEKPVYGGRAGGITVVSGSGE